MSIGKGINSWVGYGSEATYGTKGAIDRFFPIVTESLRHIKDTFTSESLSPDWHPTVYYSAGRNEGSLVFEQAYTGIELFWHSLLGTYVFTTGAPTAGVNTHLFLHVPATNASPKLSIEDVRGVGGTDEATYLGMYATKATVEFSPRQTVRTTFDMVGQGVSHAAATAKTFPALSFVVPAAKSLLTLGGSSLPVLSGSVEIEVPRATDREHFGAALYKEPVVNDRPSATFSLECELDTTAGSDSAQLMTDFEDETEIAGLVLSFEGSIITGTTKETFTITGTNAFITEATPSVQDNGITKITINGKITDGLSVKFYNTTAQVS